MTRSDIQGLIGASVSVAIVLAALLAPWIAPYGLTERVGDVWAEPSAMAWLGLDNLGRDMWSRLLYGAQTTILIALAGTGLAFVAGTTLGICAAIAGGLFDSVLSRLVDVVMAVPSLILALVLLSVLGTSIPILIGTVALLASTRVYRLSHSLTASIVALEYFEAARLRQESLPWLAAREVLPNIVVPMTTEFGLRLCSNFLLIASLSFLGLGIQPPYADWGSMVRDNASAISFGGLAPLIPAAAIALFTISINFIIDWGLARQSHQND